MILVLNFLAPISSLTFSNYAALVVQVLCIQGFLTCRKHAERIILLVEMMQVWFHFRRMSLC